MKADRADYDFTDNVEMKVYELGEYAESVVYQEHEEVLKLELAKETDGEKTKITGKVNGVSGCKVRLVNCQAVNVRGAASEKDGHDTIITLERDSEFSCEV